MTTTGRVVDARGKACPMPLVMAAKAIREIGSGDTLIVMADDDAFEADIQAWCKKTGNELIALSRRPDYVEAEVKRG